jgi:ABC-type uncharacterized transport system involved in gliding motility auxiliary subunit
MDRSFKHILILLAGLALLGTAGSVHSVLLEAKVWNVVLAFAGIALFSWGAYGLRRELGGMVRHRRGEIALHTLGVVGILIAIGYLTLRFPARFDMSTAGHFSLAPATVQMLERLEKPVHITFFHDPMMRETVDLYKLMARQSDKVSVEFFDPMLNPAQARARGVEFAGTAIMESGTRKVTVNGPTETDIANGILRVSQSVEQVICFLDGHLEADPFSLESHDHSEGNAGHSHGLGGKLVIHERHGMAKARHGLEAMNYVVRKSTMPKSSESLAGCALLVVAGPKVPLLPGEAVAIDGYLSKGGNALFMLDPFLKSGLEPIIEEFGIVLDDGMVIDETSHFWTDVSAPAVTEYNRHSVTQDLPLTFFPGVRTLSPTRDAVPGVSVRPVVAASKNSYVSRSLQRVERDQKADKEEFKTLMVVANRRPESVASAEALLRGDMTAAQARAVSGKVSSRIAIIGDSDFATNSFFHVMGNGKLFMNTVNHLAARENLIGLEPRTYDRPQVNLTNRQMKGTFFLSIILIPALMSLIGVAMWWKQR